jgi:hypothetical protein
MIKVGDKVKIYQKPLTQEEYEGEAIVKNIISESEDYGTHAQVEFLDEPGALYFRIIYKP